jgi:hypothetical protein
MATCYAQTPWVHVYYNNDASFLQADMDDILDITFSEDNAVMNLNGADGSRSVKMGSVAKWIIGPNVARLNLTTDTYTSEIKSKTEYVTGTAQLLGRGVYDDFETTAMQIRGRGNTTWNYSKKPYRVKFEKKQILADFKKQKNYVLLANYLDPAMMRTEVAYAFGKIIGLDHVNHVIPVDVYLNDIYKGSYMLTEKVGFNNGSINDLGDQEANSILFEMDTYSADADEYPWTSNYYSLPMRIKDPDAPTDEDELITWWSGWIEDFDEFEKALYNGDDDIFDKYVDLDALVKYVMTNDICHNAELNHPKSTYLHKTRGGKYFFGPAWDFDWAFEYTGTKPTATLLYSNYNGGKFFLQLCNNERFLQRFGEIWRDFYDNHRQELLDVFDQYADTLEPSAANDGQKWSSTKGFRSNVATLRTWVSQRLDYINASSTYLLW